MNKKFTPEFEINIFELLKIFWSRKIWLIVFIFFFAVAGYITSKKLYPDTIITKIPVVGPDLINPEIRRADVREIWRNKLYSTEFLAILKKHDSFFTKSLGTFEFSPGLFDIAAKKDTSKNVPLSLTIFRGQIATLDINLPFEVSTTESAEAILVAYNAISRVIENNSLGKVSSDIDQFLAKSIALLNHQQILLDSAASAGIPIFHDFLEFNRQGQRSFMLSESIILRILFLLEKKGAIDREFAKKYLIKLTSLQALLPGCSNNCVEKNISEIRGVPILQLDKKKFATMKTNNQLYSKISNLRLIMAIFLVFGTMISSLAILSAELILIYMGRKN